ncbi:MAG: 4Fe-4S binding protein [Smithellaceae bacterium]|nr:4Fe-4S binding protein [Smithellaceae bacterium]
MPYTINSQTCLGDGACKRFCPTNAISGEAKKPHSIDSELCIECGACGRVCPKASVFTPSGYIATMTKRSAWPKPQVNNKKCISCSICIDACPTACLALSGATGKDKHGHPYMKNEKACIACAYCAHECPVDAIVMVAPQPAAETKA